MSDRCLELTEGPSGIAVSLLGDHLEQRRSGPNPLGAEPSIEVGQGPIEQLDDVGDRERLEHEDLATGQERAGQTKAGILGGRSDESDGPSLHVRKKGILLSSIEPVDLIAKKNRTDPFEQPTLRFLDDLPNPRDAFGHRAEGDK